MSLSGLFFGNLSLDVSLLHLRLCIFLFFRLGLGLLGLGIRVQWVISGGLSFCRFFFLFGLLGLRISDSGFLGLIVDQIIEYFDILFMFLVTILSLLLFCFLFFNFGSLLVISDSFRLFIVLLLGNFLQFLLLLLKLLLLDQELTLRFVLFQTLFGLLRLFLGLLTLSNSCFSAVNLVLYRSGDSSNRTRGDLVRFGYT